MPIKNDGSALPAMISIGRNGVTSSWSNVPSSRSRATDMAVSNSVCNIVSVPINAGNHVPARDQVRVVPGARLEANGRRHPVLAPPVGVEVVDDRADSRRRSSGGVRVAAVGDHLHVRRLACQQAPFKIVFDLQHHERAAIVDVVLDVVVSSQVGHALESRRAVEPCQELGRCGAAILVEHGERHVVQVERGRVAEDQAL